MKYYVCINFSFKDSANYEVFNSISEANKSKDFAIKKGADSFVLNRKPKESDLGD